MKKSIFAFSTLLLFPFGVMAAPEVQVNFPNGGEEELSQKSSQFTWQTNFSSNSNYLTAVGFEDDMGRYYSLESNKLMTNNSFNWNVKNDFVYPTGRYKVKVHVYPFHCIPAELVSILYSSGTTKALCGAHEYASDMSDNYFTLSAESNFKPTVQVLGASADPILISNGSFYTTASVKVQASGVPENARVYFLIYDQETKNKLLLPGSSAIKNGTYELPISIPSQASDGSVFEFGEKGKVFTIVAGVYEESVATTEDCLFRNCQSKRKYLTSGYTRVVIHKNHLEKVYVSPIKTPETVDYSVKKKSTIKSQNSSNYTSLDTLLSLKNEVPIKQGSASGLKARLLRLKEKAQAARMLKSVTE